MTTIYLKYYMNAFFLFELDYQGYKTRKTIKYHWDILRPTFIQIQGTLQVDMKSKKLIYQDSGWK